MLFLVLLLFVVTACGQYESDFVDRKPTSIPTEGEGVTTESSCPLPDETQILDSGVREVEVEQKGKRNKIETFFATGKACLKQSIQQVWHTLKTPEGVQWTDSTLDEFEPIPPEPEMVESWIAEQHATGYSFANWTLIWSHRLVTGTVEQPKILQVQFHKTTARFTEHWWGELVLQRLSDTDTDISMQIELKGFQIGVEKCLGAVRTQIQRLRAPPVQSLRL